jgi:ABC-type dipeptide/oligopeptide/nickel transport system ATPase component
MDVLQRQYEIRLERMAVTKQLEAQLAAIKARDAAEAVEIQHAMTPPKRPYTNALTRRCPQSRKSPGS